MLLFKNPAAVSRTACAALFIFLFGLFSGCVDSTSEPPQQVQEVVINAESIAKLSPGEKLIVDRSENVVYTFDFAAGAIDFSRILLRMENGREVPMDQWLANSEYGKKIRTAPNRAFRLSPNKESFSRLSSLKERNAKLLESFKQNVLICEVYVSVIIVEMVECTPEGCTYWYVEIVEVTIICYDDGTEP